VEHGEADFLGCAGGVGGLGAGQVERVEHGEADFLGCAGGVGGLGVAESVLAEKVQGRMVDAGR